MALQKAVNQSSLEPALVELVKLRASQINRCAFCIDMHFLRADQGREPGALVSPRCLVIDESHHADVLDSPRPVLRSRKDNCFGPAVVLRNLQIIASMSHRKEVFLCLFVITWPLSSALLSSSMVNSSLKPERIFAADLLSAPAAIRLWAHTSFRRGCIVTFRGRINVLRSSTEMSQFLLITLLEKR